MCCGTVKIVKSNFYLFCQTFFENVIFFPELLKNWMFAGKLRKLNAFCLPEFVVLR